MKSEETLEQELKTTWLERLDKDARDASIPCKYVCLESGGTQKAIPDTFITLDKMKGWLEFKRVRDINNMLVKYQPGQLNELRVWTLHEMFAATVGITQSYDFVIAVPNPVLLNTDLTSNLYPLTLCRVRQRGSIGQQLAVLRTMMQEFYRRF